jgi:chromosome segregation ATPase
VKNTVKKALKAITPAITPRERLLLKLDGIETLLNQVSITLDDLREDMLSLDKKVDKNHDGIWSDLLDTKSDLNREIRNIKGDIDGIDIKLCDLESTAEHAHSTADNAAYALEELISKVNTIENDVSDVLLLKG